MFGRAGRTPASHEEEMTDDLFRRAREVFQASFEVSDEERPALLTELCAGDEYYSLSLHDALPMTGVQRSEEHTSELQSLRQISYAVFCLKKKKSEPSGWHRSNSSSQS